MQETGMPRALVDWSEKKGKTLVELGSRLDLEATAIVELAE